MCGRYIIRMQAKSVAEWEKYGPPPFLESFNVAPTNEVPILRMIDGKPQFTTVRWGLIPYFARGEPGKLSTINARIETFETAASYKAPWQRGRRCLQLASGFIEWHIDEGGRKAPYVIELADQQLFGFAGLWDRSVKADGTAIDSCVHITMPGNALLQHIHNGGNNPYRMPAIVAAEDRDAWLFGTKEEARAVLKQYPADLMDAYEVSTRINSVKNNEPSLIEPVSVGGVRQPEPFELTSDPVPIEQRTNPV